MLASFTLQQDYGVQLGTVIHVPFEAPSQAAAYDNPNRGPQAPGAAVAFQVVGIEATEIRVPLRGRPLYYLLTTPAFARAVLPRTAVEYQYFVRLRHGAADVPRFDDEVSSLDRGAGYVAIPARTGKPPRSRHRFIPRPSAGGSSPRSPHWSDWRSSARPSAARASSRARTIRRWRRSA